MAEEIKTTTEENTVDSTPDKIEIRKGEYEGLKTQIGQLKSQLSEFQSMKESIERDKSEQEKAKLLETEKFEEYRALLEKEKSDMASQLEALRQETLAKDLKFALAQKGLKHDKALKMFVSDFLNAADKPSIDEYVESIVSDESNKIFFSSEEPVRRPGGFAPSGTSSSVGPNNDLVKRLANGDVAAQNEVASLPDNQRFEIVEQARKLVRSK